MSDETTGQSASLVLVATPIGNLGDLPPRAADALRGADLVLAEDTRRARALLSHLGIAGKPVARLDAHVEAQGCAEWIERMRSGSVVAFVSDAGTPAVSDPGAVLVRAAVAAGLGVTVIPGPSAVTMAVAGSGFGGGAFRFVGFLPRSGKERSKAVGELAQASEPVVLFEAPARLAATLRELASWMARRHAVVGRELTKMHEQWLRGTLAELAAQAEERTWLGELTIVLGPWQSAGGELSVDDPMVTSRLEELLGRGSRPKDVARMLALETGLPARELYARACAARGRK